MRLQQPAHPGAFLRREILEPAGLSVTEAAKALQLKRPALSDLLNARTPLTRDMARRVENAFGVRMETLVQMQTAYDLAAGRAPQR